MNEIYPNIYATTDRAALESRLFDREKSIASSSSAEKILGFIPNPYATASLRMLERVSAGRCAIDFGLQTVLSRSDAPRPQRLVAFGRAYSDTDIFERIKETYQDNAVLIGVRPHPSLEKYLDVIVESWRSFHFFAQEAIAKHEGRRPLGWAAQHRPHLAAAAGALSLGLYMGLPHDLAEARRMLRDWFTDKKATYASSEVLIDTHVHLAEDTKIDDIVKAPADIFVLLDWGTDSPAAELSFARLKERALGQSTYSVTVHGALMHLGPKIIVGGQEICDLGEGGHHIITVGGRTFRFGESTDAVIKDSHGLTILAHPYAVQGSPLPYRVLTPDEEPALRELLAQVDAMEEFDSQLLFWMGNANTAARNSSVPVPRVAGSDTHFNVGDIGLSGIIVDRERIDSSSDRAFVESLRWVLRDGHYRTHTEYTNPITFATGTAVAFLNDDPRIAGALYGLTALACMGIGFTTIKRVKRKRHLRALKKT